jgi:ubiquitin C-terminal hydrolase
MRMGWYRWICTQGRLVNFSAAGAGGEKVESRVESLKQFYNSYTKMASLSVAGAGASAGPDAVLATKIGLGNLGNTCFLNSVLQALRLSWPLADLFLPYKSLPIRAESKKKDLLEAFQVLLRDFWRVVPAEGTQPTLIPHGFFHKLRIVLQDTEDDWYRPGQQSDAAEALQYILDSLHDALQRPVRMDVVGSAIPASAEEAAQRRAIESWIGFFKKEYSEIVKQFYGQVQIAVQCTECKTVSERYEPWLMLKAPIPLPGTHTLASCLDAAFAPETLADYQCDTCAKKVAAILRTRISHLPPVTILTLKRFTNTGAKLSGKIAWDLNALDFAPYFAFSYDPITGTGTSATPPLYETFAVIEHKGFAQGGHYRMYGKQGSVWNEYDDSAVRTVHPDAVVTEDSYILFLMPRATAPQKRVEFSNLVSEFRIAYTELNAGK